MSKDIIRAMRLPFITASVLPFIFGSLIAKPTFNFLTFLLGLIAAASCHLSANVINDYADSKSGADWQDKSFYGFFGGSKLIQEGVLSEKFYFNLASFFALLSGVCVILLAVILKNISIIGFFLLIIALSWTYSQKPLQFAYRRIGEFFIFILFGPAVVMGGYFIQTKIFPHWQSLFLSLPFAFFTTNILFANEVPDFPQDKAAGKFTWVSITGPKNAYILYALLAFSGFFAIALAMAFKYLSPFAAASFLLIPPSVKAIKILKRDHADKIKLVESSKLTILTHNLASVILIIAILLRK